MKRTGKFALRAALLAGIGATGTGCGYGIQDWELLFLRPWPSPTSTPADLGLDYESVWIPSRDGNLVSAWFVPSTVEPALATILIHTGMEGSIQRYLEILPPGVEGGFHMLVYDWQGFGASEGRPSFVNFRPDTQAAVAYLLSRPESEAARIIHLGVSLGSIPALGAAAEFPDPTLAIVVFGGFFPDEIAPIWLATRISPIFTCLGWLAGNLWVALLPEFLDPRDHFPRLDAPILAVIPRDDSTIPPLAQERFFEALPEPKALYLSFGDHARAHLTDPDLLPTVIRWCQEVATAAPPPD